MFNKVLWTVDNELNGEQFERLCVDLLFRSGYRDIVPVEPQDGGRDAEEYPRRGRGRVGELCFFQFSKQEDWKSKLRRDMQRVYDGGHRPSRFVFVTSRAARGVDRDLIAREALQRYEWDLTIYSREWLRLQVEEAHPDLAQKYLGIEDTGGRQQLTNVYPGSPIEGADVAQARTLFEEGSYERAAVELRDLLVADQERPSLWQALAWCQYQTRRYDDALASINRAIALDASPQGQSIRGCILAERGIERHDRASLFEAKELFLWVASQEGRGSWPDWYNLGNVLSALGNHEEAIEHYLQAIEINAAVVEIWKNLASAYHLVGDHEREMECFDRALELDPLKPEALASKGISLLVDFDQPHLATQHLQKALSVDESWSVRWPHIWYWLAEAYRQSGRSDEALQSVEEGLRQQPGHLGLRRQKADLLAALTATDAQWLPVAEKFFESALEIEPHDLSARERLIHVKIALDEVGAAWALLDECFTVFDMQELPSLANSGFVIEEVLTAVEALPTYVKFREYRPINDYWDRGDDLYDLPFEAPKTTQACRRLEAFLLVPFGLALNELQQSRGSGSFSQDSFLSVMTLHSARVKSVVTEASRELASLIPNEGSAQEKSEPITNIILFLGLLALRELSAQIGFLASVVGVPPEELQQATEAFPYGDFQVDVISSCLQPLNSVAKFAPED